MTRQTGQPASRPPGGKKRYPGAKKTHPGEQLRHSAPIRLIHWLHMAVMLGLAVTGLYLSEPVFRVGLRPLAYARLWHGVLWPLLLGTTTAHIYLAFAEGGYKDLAITWYDLRTAGHLLKNQLLLVKTSPQRGKYQLLQKVLYLSFLMAIIFQTLTGLAIYQPPSFAWLIGLFHGLQVARFWHYVGALYLTATVTLHLYRALAETDGLKSMITGYSLRRPPVNTPEELAGRPEKLR